MSTLNKDEKILSSTVENEDESKNRFLLLLTKIPPDVLLAVSGVKHYSYVRVHIDTHTLFT